MLEFTAKLVKRCGSKMYVLHMVPPCLMDMSSFNAMDSLAEGFIGAADSTTDCPTDLLSLADARVKKLAAYIGDKWQVPIYGKAEESDSLVACLDDFCRRHHIDMLVISRRQHSLLGNLILGNTTEKLLRHIRIPVVVVPSIDEDESSETNSPS